MMPVAPAPRPTLANHLPALDGVRALAALTVALFHLEVLVGVYHQPRLRITTVFDFAGQNAVVCFFTLSGMLITWLLLVERERTDTINVSRFYLKRVLRIWPLYYIIVLSGLYWLPQIDFLQIDAGHRATTAAISFKDQALYLTFFANAFKIEGAVWYLLINHVWSIGLEEQFYVVWPWLGRLRLRVFLTLVVSIIFLFMAARLYIHIHQVGRWASSIVSYFCFDAMAWGALAGFVLHRARAGTLPARWQAALHHRAVAWGLSTGAVALCFLQGASMSRQVYLPLLAAWFAATLLVLALQPRAVPILSWAPLRWLGRISYGLYMYNVIAIIGAYSILIGLGIAPATRSPMWLLAYYTLGIALNIALAAISYFGLERYILRLRRV